MVEGVILLWLVVLGEVGLCGGRLWCSVVGGSDTLFYAEKRKFLFC